MIRNLFIAIFLLASASINAQDVSFGLRGGPSLTTLGGDQGGGEDTKFRLGFHFGGFVSIPVSETLDFDLGLQFANKGAKNSTGNSSSVFRNGYLDLPLLFNIKTGENFYLLAGAQPSFLISSAAVLGDGENKVTVNGSEIRDLWKGVDFAGVLGLGLKLSDKMHIQTTYEHGFANISEISDQVYNRGIKLTLGKTF
ncbi:porin family protein [Algoriphagus litoralis]|uniref:porin family protein n=1 Tax=Algoriphagus litoralis TaxID=2202829 RepID=UPI000DB9B9D4|nr:porin family protein [Algoriphagus litoralis]